MSPRRRIGQHADASLSDGRLGGKGGDPRLQRGTSLSESDNELVLSEARKWLDQALERDEFDLAEQSLSAALSAARRLRDTKLIGTLTAARKKSPMRGRHGRRWPITSIWCCSIPRTRRPTKSWGVTTAWSSSAGRTACPCWPAPPTRDWPSWPHLELKPPDAPSEQLALADRWWMYAECEAKHKLALRTARPTGTGKPSAACRRDWNVSKPKRGWPRPNPRTESSE